MTTTPASAAAGAAAKRPSSAIDTATDDVIPSSLNNNNPSHKRPRHEQEQEEGLATGSQPGAQSHHRCGSEGCCCVESPNHPSKVSSRRTRMDTPTNPHAPHPNPNDSAAKQIDDDGIQNEYNGFTFPATGPRAVETLDLDECVKATHFIQSTAPNDRQTDRQTDTPPLTIPIPPTATPGSTPATGTTPARPRPPSSTPTSPRASPSCSRGGCATPSGRPTGSGRTSTWRRRRARRR